MADRYTSYTELKSHETEDLDFRIFIQDVGSAVTIIAPHGGKIEPRTSDIAKAVAGDIYNCYCFEGIKNENNGRLHITSHKFDEPKAVQLVTRSNIVVAIHAVAGNRGKIYLGGLDRNLKQSIAKALESDGFDLSENEPKLRGEKPLNICNRGLQQKGVQLEISRDLRDDWNKIYLISNAVRAALNETEQLSTYNRPD